MNHTTWQGKSEKLYAICKHACYKGKLKTTWTECLVQMNFGYKWQESKKKTHENNKT
jgi:hypothetical protein